MANAHDHDSIDAWPHARARLMMWSSGATDASSLPARQVAVAETADVAEALRDSAVVDDDAVVFAPGAVTGALSYEGSIAGPGTEFVIGEDFFLQVQSYAISEYVSVVGPTLVRLGDAEDVEILETDVRTAHETGVFPEFLTNPVVQLADLPALGSIGAGAGPDARLWIAADGTLAVSPFGERLGDLGSDREAVQRAWIAGCTPTADPGAVSASIPRGDLEAFVDRTPALGRFLAALEGIRNLRARRLPLPRVSGFGHALLAEVDPAAGAVLSPALPFVMSSAERHFVVAPRSRRVFEVGPDAAGAFEAVVHLGARAAEVVGADIALSATRALTAAGIDIAAPREKVAA